MQFSTFARSASGLALALALASGAPAFAGLGGQGFSAGYYYPDTATLYPFASVPADFVVGAGIEGSIDVEGVTDISFDFGDLSLTTLFSTVLTNPTWTGTAFNGIIFTSPTPLGVTSAHVVSTTLAGFDDSRITVSGNQIALNWQGLSYTDGTRIDIAFGAVPEPAAWGMMALGFGAIGGAMRRRATRVRFA